MQNNQCIAHHKSQLEEPGGNISGLCDVRLRYYKSQLDPAMLDSVPLLVMCDIRFIASHLLPTRGLFVTIVPCDLWLWLSHRNLVMLGPICKPWTSAICDQQTAGSMTTCHLALPHSLKTLPRHLLLPPIQVKLELWLALTSSYELRF